MEVAFVFVSLFIIIFGIFYLHYSTRNRERLALIEKGADASIFFSTKTQKKSSVPIWKILILNLSVLLMGIGLGIFLAIFLQGYLSFQNQQIAYPASIFLMAGVGLFVGFTLSKKLVEKE
ncbi:MAG: hypothetical protein QM495_02525 [Lutibacter sp.]|uniref:DUF6249 domain-containing protein n=1 Tax=Lutibacter sp. TaxID=1925666 RepID=UPI000BD03970|nr:MAG: hypothetical protein COC22_02065 [Flavobacteriaceae bacterium]